MDASDLRKALDDLIACEALMVTHWFRSPENRIRVTAQAPDGSVRYLVDYPTSRINTASDGIGIHIILKQ